MVAEQTLESGWRREADRRMVGCDKIEAPVEALTSAAQTVAGEVERWTGED